jgi:hypothetical protein
MLTRLTRAYRLRAASVLVLLYGLCVLAPAAAFAFGDGSRAAHCVTDDHHGLAAAHVHEGAAKRHVHQDGTTHEHAKAQDDNDKGQATNCCGLACLSALPVASADLVGAPLTRTALLSVRHDRLAGRGPNLLYRPPISLLSL